MLLVFAFSVVMMFLIVLRKRRGELVNSCLILFLGFFCLYNGWVITDKNITNEYIFYYLVFAFTLSFSFVFFYKLLARFGESSGRYLSDFYQCKLSLSYSSMIILLYVAIVFIPLLYPTFQFSSLFSPPQISLTEHFTKRFDGTTVNTVVSASGFVKTLLFPLFLLALQRRFTNILWVVSIALLVFYVEFVVAGYKSRGELMALFFPILYLYWFQQPSKRFLIMLLFFVAAPFILLLFSFYAQYRIGGDLSLADFGFMQSIKYILDSETSFILTTGLPLIASGEHVDFIMFLKWIFTLPIPKFLIGEVSGARINYEVSEIVLGIKEGASGYYILLPGLVAESIYLYGKAFFWFHAVNIAFLVAFIARLFLYNSRLFLLAGSIVFVTFYDLNRGGFSSFLPSVLNGYMVIYLILLGYKFKVFNVSNSRSLLEKDREQL